MTIYHGARVLDKTGVSTTQQVIISTQMLDRVAIFINWSNGSSPSATISVEDTGSSDDDIARGTAIWSTLTLSTPLSISGASGAHKVQLAPYSARATRVTITFASGSCDLKVDVTGNGPS